MLEKILDILKNENEFISGEYIANKINISRTAVWKNINKLKKMGYNVISIKNKGYSLQKEPFVFNKLEIENIMQTKIIGQNMYFFEEITSTNDFAKDLANKNKTEGTVIIANHQTNGRGRLERNWKSEKGSGIYLSLILRPNLELYKISQITLITGIAVCKTLEELNIEAKIKWPNDIVINNKKVCGILSELNAQIDRINYMVIGVGLNVMNDYFDNELENKATSLLLETNKIFEKKQLIVDFLKNFEDIYLEYIKAKDFSTFIEEYRRLCINIGKEVQFIYKGILITGKVLDISEDGNIIIATKDGNINISSGEVSIRNISGEYI